MRRISSRLTILLSIATFVAAVGYSCDASAATITVVNLDGPGEGFNDPTVVAPVGGNVGTTVGQQRLNAFQYAASLWGARLTSAVEIKIDSRFDPLTCSAGGGTLGQAGPITGDFNFSGAPVPDTLYPIALVNSLRGVDVDPANSDIVATFNSNVGTIGCLETSGWYYGLDGAAPSNRIDLVSVLLHEFGHGLGFLTFVDLSSGEKALGLNDTYMLCLEDHSTSKLYPDMIDAERVAASIRTGNLHWTCPNVVAGGSGLSAGRHASGHVEMFAPNPQQPTSSVAHYSTSLSPNELMEPIYTSPNHNLDLTVALMEDIGWNTTVAPTGGQFLDISTRGFVDTGDKVMIGGFIIEDAPMTVLIRAVAPSLALPPFSVPGTLANPFLQLFSGATQIAFNDNWASDPNAGNIPVGLPPTNSLESALLVTLNPGPYTAIMSGVGGGTGVGLVEVIKIGASGGTFLDISTRGLVKTGDQVMIGGFIVENESMTVLLRAVGPSLALPPFNVPGTLANPTLNLFAVSTVAAVIGTNDNWSTGANSSLIPTPLKPTNANESALLIALPPGAYTGIVSGVSNTTGVGLVEVIKMSEANVPLGAFSGAYTVETTVTSDGCDTGEKEIFASLDIRQAGNSLAVEVFGEDIFLVGTVNGSEQFSLMQTNPEVKTEGSCNFRETASASGKFTDETINITVTRQAVSGSCPMSTCSTKASGDIIPLF